MTEERVTVSIREVERRETVTWLSVGEYGGRPVLQKWEHAVGSPARVIGRWWLEPVEEGR